VQRNAVQGNSLNVTMHNGYDGGSSNGIQPNGGHVTGYQKVVIGSFTAFYGSRFIARVVLLTHCFWNLFVKFFFQIYTFVYYT
jgi:hypothetical protein